MRNNLKKLLALGICLSMTVAGLTGCGESAPATTETAVTENADQTADTTAKPVENTQESSEQSGESAKIEEPAASENNTEAAAEATSETANEASEAQADETASVPISEKDMKDITPTELVAQLTTGWNLGNTFDAFGKSGLDAETHWGNPKTTKEMIDAVAAKGFNTIRIPVTWADHMGAAPDYTVEPEWMARVKEVVDYCIEDELYVIINAHHEETWRIPDDAHIDATAEQMEALWKQIAEEFKDYNYHLIFEGMNEPRVKGGENEWSGGTSEVRKCIDRLNQLFVDTVRASGGNNEYRLVLITSVASSHVIQTIAPLKIPEDDHLAVSIHAYTPYSFTYDDASAGPYDKWDGSHKSDIINVFSDLNRIFIEKGIPVLLTEYGAMNKNNDSEVEAWVTEYLTRAKKCGIPCYWWDNGIYDQSGEKFSIFNRRECTWYRESVVDAIMAVYEN